MSEIPLLIEYLREMGGKASAKLEGTVGEGTLPVQDLVVLCEMCEEQMGGEGDLGPITQRVVKRDFGSLQALEALLTRLASDKIDWLVLGLAFSTFDFRVFGFRHGAPPFCVTPVLSLCVDSEAQSRTGLSCTQLLDQQLAELDWAIVEARLNCLQQPLDFFSEPESCSANLKG